MTLYNRQLPCVNHQVNIIKEAACIGIDLASENMEPEEKKGKKVEDNLRKCMNSPTIFFVIIIWVALRSISFVFFATNL